MTRGASYGVMASTLGIDLSRIAGRESKEVGLLGVKVSGIS